MRTSFKAVAVCGLASIAVATPVWSETQTENVVQEQRVSVSMRISPEAAQAFMPAGWTPSSPNLSVIFMDRGIELTPDGKPLQAGLNRMLVLSMAGKNIKTGEVRGMIVGGYSADPLGMPGAYKVYRPGTVTVTRHEVKETRDGQLATQVEEHWAAKGADGAYLTLDLTYTRGTAVMRSFEQKNYSGADPDFYRIYRGQQAVDTLRGQGVDHVQSITLKASGGALGKAVNGTEQITGISAAPFYERQTFLP